MFRRIYKLLFDIKKQHPTSNITYIKLKFIIKILNELKICGVEQIDEDHYRFDVYFSASKTNIEKSSITLVGFGKTSLLEPNEKETLNIKLDIKDLSKREAILEKTGFNASEYASMLRRLNKKPNMY